MKLTLPKPTLSLLVPLTSGTLMGLTPAPINAWFLAWVALAPLWVLVVRKGNQQEEQRSSAFAVPLLFGLVWGVGYHGLAISWITGVHPMTWMGVPWLASLAIALFCWVFLTLWGAVLVAIWAWGMSRLNNHSQSPPSWLRVLIGTALWCGLEALWSNGPLWWTSLSYTQSPHNLVILHLGQLSGPTAITGAIVAVNGFLAEAWLQNSHPKSTPLLGMSSREMLQTPNLQFLIAAALFITLHLIGFALYSRPLVESPEAAIRVGIIQGNIPNTIKLYKEGYRRAIAGYTTGYETLADQGVDAVLTPEVALPVRWSEQNRIHTSFYQAVMRKGVLAWLGAFGGQGNDFTNSLFAVEGNGETFSEYQKIKLVPLGEYIPFEQWVGTLVNRLSPLDAHLIAGQPKQIFNTPLGRAIAGICYESAFSSHFRDQAATGGEFILTASNNAHYSSSMPAQHHAQDVMRAVETDRWAARATNTGYSGFVDPHGRTIWISGINTYELHAATLYRRQTQTLYVRWGDWLAPLLGIGGAIAWGLQSRACFKSPVED